MQDIQTLATINEVLIERGERPGTHQPKVVPYIFIAPRTPNAIGEIARELYRKHYRGMPGLCRAPDLSLLGRFLGAAESATRGELYSYLCFAGDFAAKLIELGQEDAQHWIDGAHDERPWQHRRLPQASEAPIVHNGRREAGSQRRVKLRWASTA
jgi:NTE family protein